MRDKAKAYSREKHRLAIINIFLSPSLFVIFILIGLPSYLKRIALSVSPNEYISLFVFSMLICAVYYLATMPLSYYSGFLVEHKFSLSNQAFAGWLKREIKKGVVSFIISLPYIFFLYISIKYSPLHWWLLTALLCFFMSVLITKLAPVFIVPIFYKYSPIKNKELQTKLIKLASSAGFRAAGVYEINMSKDTKKANAALIGLGTQKRIVLCDTLLENFNDNEIESVMGHELGHHKLRHILKLILFGGLSITLTLFLTSIFFYKLHNIAGYLYLYDFESLVLIYAIISLLNIFTLPLYNAFSKKLERDADIFALKATGNKSAFISTMHKLAEQNLADISPGRFYEIMLYDHPPISRRIALAESFESKK